MVSLLKSDAKLSRPLVTRIRAPRDHGMCRIIHLAEESIDTE